MYLFQHSYLKVFDLQFDCEHLRLAVRGSDLGLPFQKTPLNHRHTILLSFAF